MATTRQIAQKMLYDMVQAAYNKLLREKLPTADGTYNGVVSHHDFRLLDATKERPNYKQGMVNAINRTVTDGDVVVDIGVGRGILTVKSIENGAEMVYGYDAAPEMIATARDAIERNVKDGLEYVSLYEGIVGQPGASIYGTASETVISPDTLPRSDVMIMDVEGAEQSIIPDLEYYPETMIVESHPGCGAEYRDTIAMLEEVGYTIEKLQYDPSEPITEKPVLLATY